MNILYKVIDNITGEVIEFAHKRDAEMEVDRRISIHGSYWCGRRYEHQPIKTRVNFIDSKTFEIVKND